MINKRRETIGELFTAARRVGTFTEHRFVAVQVGRYSNICTFCRDCGYQPSSDLWWRMGGGLKAPECEPDKFRPSWFINYAGPYVTREKIEDK
jgi:hypothetical protein